MASEPTLASPTFPTSLLSLRDGTKLDPPIAFGPFLLRQLVRRSNMSLPEDLHSTDGLFINGRRVPRRRLVHGDSIHAGKQDWVFHDGRPPIPDETEQE